MEALDMLSFIELKHSYLHTAVHKRAMASKMLVIE